jgi:glucokinase
MTLLAADVGGTKTLLALAEERGDGVRIVASERYPSADFPGFDDMVARFLASHGDARGAPRAACFAVAGPIAADGVSAHVTNVGWHIDASRLAHRFGIPAVRLINDFQAQAYGIDTLSPADLHVLQEGTPRAHGVRTVIGAGTGLGMGQLVWQGGHYAALPSEGGHADFAPRGALQCALLAWLNDQYGDHVSIEHVLSGPGLSNIYRFLAAREPQRASAALARAMAEGDAGAAISAFAFAEPADALAREALDLFVAIYGAHAGSLALTLLPYGGLFISGGIAARIIDAITERKRFIDAFNAKGIMSKLTATIPVAVVMNPDAGLHGALQAARETPPPSG